MKLVALILLSLSSPAFAGDGLLSYLVFSKTSIQSQSSDYQGATAALGTIDLSRFEVNGNLESASRIRMQDGSVRGLVKAPSVTLSRVGARRGRSDSASVQALGYDLDALSLRLSSLASTGSAHWETASNGSKSMVLESTRSLEVIDLGAEALAQAGSLKLRGQGGLLLVRISGEQVRFDHKNIELEGMRPEQVVFFFREARALEISYTGGAAWGIPGAVVAPNALVHFAEALITGQLYAGQICTNRGLNGGQVNESWSILLDRLMQGCASSCS